MTTHQDWRLALDRLEGEVDRAEQLVRDPASAASDHEPWAPPRVAGPIPADLADRAIAIQARQVAAETALSAALVVARRQHRFADRVDRATGRTEQAVYVDLEA